ncbi:MAG TPA: hypothetical protein DFK12_12340 [Gallionellaceae bacterium]|nr:hypothetical protein [Gallionellaceae bacterium]
MAVSAVMAEIQPFRSLALGSISERPDMSLSNELLELHGINVVVKEAINTHEIIRCSGSTPKPFAPVTLPQRVAIGLQNRRMI